MTKYKKAEIDSYIKWKGKLAWVFGKTRDTFVHIELVERPKCEKCGHPQPKHQFDVIESSPLFQENAGPVRTLEKANV